LGKKINLGLVLFEKSDYFEGKSFWGIRGIWGLSFLGNKAILGVCSFGIHFTWRKNMIG
jgi:hypothetical protein